MSILQPQLGGKVLNGDVVHRLQVVNNNKKLCEPVGKQKFVFGSGPVSFFLDEVVFAEKEILSEGIPGSI
jgi:hypothetical protein